MQNLQVHHGGGWQEYNVNRDAPIAISNYDTAGSVILSVGPPQTMQLLPTSSHPQNVAPVMQQHAVMQMPTQPTLHNNQMQQLQNTDNQHMSNLLPPQNGQHGMVVCNQQTPSNMIWQQNNAQQNSQMIDTSQSIVEIHPVLGTLVNVGVQASVFQENPVSNSNVKSFNTAANGIKLPAKKRHLQVDEIKNPPNTKMKCLNKTKTSASQQKCKSEGAYKKKPVKIDSRKKRSSNPLSWKKNIRKMMRVQGKGYVNTKGVYVPPKTRSGPPCNCRMKCYESISVEECNEIFDRFFQIANKDIQDALLYILIAKEEPKHRRPNKTGEEKPNTRNATFYYHVASKEGIVRVCCNAFMSIFGITQKRVRRLQQHKCIDPLNPPKDLRGKHGHQKLLSLVRARKQRQKEASDSALNLVMDKTEKNAGISTQPQQNTMQLNSSAGDLLDQSLNLPVCGVDINYSNLNQVGELAVSQAMDISLMDSSGFLSGFLMGVTGDQTTAKYSSQSTAELSQTVPQTNAALSNNTEQQMLAQTLAPSQHQYMPPEVVSQPCRPPQQKVMSSTQGLVTQVVTPDPQNTASQSKTPSNPTAASSTQLHSLKEMKQLVKQQKKRNRNPDQWKKNIRKNNRAHGKSYVNYKGDVVPAKSRSGPPCQCRMGCYQRITVEECNSIFRDFHNIGEKDVQDAILFNLMIHKEVKHKKNKSTASEDGLKNLMIECEIDTNSSKARTRQSTFWYYVQQSSGLTRVCSNAFMSIYGATQKRLRRLQEHKVSNPVLPPKDMRGKHSVKVTTGKNETPRQSVIEPSQPVVPASQAEPQQFVQSQSQPFMTQNNMWTTNMLC